MNSNIQNEIQQAAQKLEDLLNRYSNQLDVSITSFDVSLFGNLGDIKRFQIKIVSTQPFQIY